MTDHYFSGQPATPDKRLDITTHIWGRDMTFTTASGVFATDGLDKATAVPAAQQLAATTAAPCSISVAVGDRSPAPSPRSPDAAVWAVDTNERALELTRLNAERLGVTVHAALPDEVPADVEFDEIWSNPPIRIGKDALHDLLLRWLPRLAPHGSARLVVGKNLGADSLQAWLDDRGLAHRTRHLRKGLPHPAESAGRRCRMPATLR